MTSLAQWIMMVKAARKEEIPPDNEIWYWAPEQVTLYTQAGVQSHTFADGKGIITMTDAQTSQHAAQAYLRQTPVTRVVMPDGITVLKAYAFHKCTSLASLRLPSTLTAIENTALSLCSSLETLDLPSGITSLGAYCFGSSSSLVLTSLPQGITEIPLGLCQACISNRIASLPPCITSIGDYAFQNNKLNTFDTIPAGVRSIGNVAISTSAASLTFLGTPSSIHTNALSRSYNPNLTDIYVPWAEGAVANAPWGATSATIHYNHTGGA